MSQQIEVSVIVDNDTDDIYVKFSGFADAEEANEYAEYLIEFLPLALFESDTKH